MKKIGKIAALANVFLILVLLSEIFKPTSLSPMEIIVTIVMSIAMVVIFLFR